MISTIATLFVLALLLLMAYAGQRDGLFSITYVLARNFLGFLFAMTFNGPLARIIGNIFGSSYPMPAYLRVFSFALIFAAVYMVVRSLEFKYTSPDVRSIPAVDRVGGAIVGMLNAMVVSGTFLILWSMMPFLPYLPGNVGDYSVRIDTLDSGAALLHTYNLAENAMGGGAPFLLHDEPIENDRNNNGRVDPGESYVDLNLNGQWDRGWLWKYKNPAAVLPNHLDKALQRRRD